MSIKKWYKSRISAFSSAFKIFLSFSLILFSVVGYSDFAYALDCTGTISDTSGNPIVTPVGVVFMDADYNYIGETTAYGDGTFLLSLDSDQEGFLDFFPYDIDAPETWQIVCVNGAMVCPYQPRTYYKPYGECQNLQIELPEVVNFVIKGYDVDGNLMKIQDYEDNGTSMNQFLSFTNLNDQVVPATIVSVFTSEQIAIGDFNSAEGLPAIMVDKSLFDEPNFKGAINALYWKTSSCGKLFLRTDNSGSGFGLPQPTNIDGTDYYSYCIELNTQLAKTAVYDLVRRNNAGSYNIIPDKEIEVEGVTYNIDNKINELKATVDALPEKSADEQAAIANAQIADTALDFALKFRDEAEFQAAKSEANTMKGSFKLQVLDKLGQPVEGAKVTLKQKSRSNDFMFGAFQGPNGEYYNSAKENAYRKMKDAGMDLTTLLLPWNITESGQSPYNYHGNSYLDDWYGIESLIDMGFKLKTHGTVWMEDYFLPSRDGQIEQMIASQDWFNLKNENINHQSVVLDSLLEEFNEMQESFIIAEAVNEPANHNDVGMPKTEMIDFLDQSSRSIFNKGLKTLVNGPHEFDFGYKYSAYSLDNEPLDDSMETFSLFLDSTQTSGALANIDIIGLQFYPGYHLNDAWGAIDGPCMTPSWLIDIADRYYQQFGKDIHITEFCVPSNYNYFQLETAPQKGYAAKSGLMTMYVPINDNLGTDSFIFSVDNGESSDTAEVSINIVETDGSLTAYPREVTCQKNLDGSMDFCYIILNSSLDNQAALYYIISSVPQHGTAQIMGYAPYVIYQPNYVNDTYQDYTGQDQFTFGVSQDGQNFVYSTVTINIVERTDNVTAYPKTVTTAKNSLTAMVLNGNIYEYNSGYWKERWNENVQAEYAEKLFTMMLAHPHVQSIIWWDILDYMSSVVGGGILKEDGTEKLVYEAIKNVIKPEAEGVTNSLGEVIIEDIFSGEYDIEVDIPGGDDIEDSIEVISETQTDYNALLNNAPKAVQQIFVTHTNTSVVLNLRVFDADNDELTYEILENPENGILAGELPGLAYVPNDDYNGVDYFTYRVIDENNSLSEPMTVYLKTRQLPAIEYQGKAIRYIASGQSLPSSINSGEVVLLEAGGQWRETLQINTSGTENDPIIIGSYGEGAVPSINGADELLGWTNISENTWKVNLSTEPLQIIFNGIRGKNVGTFQDIDDPFEWCWQGDELRIYATTSPTNIEASQRGLLVSLYTKEYITIKEIEFKNTQNSSGGCIELNHTRNVTLKHLNVSNNVVDYFGAITIASQDSNWGHSNTITECIISNTSETSGNYISDGGVGIYLFGLETGSYVNNNEITRNVVRDSDMVAINILNGSYNLVSENTVYNTGYSGIQIGWEVSKGNIVEHNHVYSNCITRDDGFGINFHRVGNGNTARYNYVHDQHDTLLDESAMSNPEFNGIKYGTGGIRFDGGMPPGGSGTEEFIESTGNAVYGNIICNERRGINAFNCSNVEIINNTVYNSTDFGIDITSANDLVPMPDVENTIIVNNLICKAGKKFINQMNTVNAVLVYNYATDNPNEVFADVDSGDFNILPDSLVRDTGIGAGLSYDIEGNPVSRLADIGAVEYSAPIAIDREYVTDVNIPVDIPLEVILKGDSNLSYEVVEFPEEYTLTGAFPDLIYTPMQNYTGEDSFTFKAVDSSGRESNIARISVKVKEPHSGGAIYYLDSENGDNTNDGSINAPWKTISKLFEITLNPGDKVLLKCEEVWREELLVMASGTIDNPIIFGAYGNGKKPLICGADIFSNWTDAGNKRWTAQCDNQPFQVFFDDIRGREVKEQDNVDAPYEWQWFNSEITVHGESDPSSIYTSPGIEVSVRTYAINILQDVEYVAIEDLAVSKTGANDFGSCSVVMVGTNNVILDNLSVLDATGICAVLLYSNSADTGWNNEIKNCTVYDTFNIIQDSGSLGWGISLYNQDALHGGNNIISKNICYRNTGNGISVIFSNCIISENICYSNGWAGISVSELNSHNNIIQGNLIFDNNRLEDDDFGINLYRVGSNNIVRYNTIFNQYVIPEDCGFVFGPGGIRFDGGGDGVTNTIGNMIYYNLIYDEYKGIEVNNYSNVEVYNNVVYNSELYGIHIITWGQPLTNPENNTIKNNILYSTKGYYIFNNQTDNTVLDNNLYYPDRMDAFNFNDYECDFQIWKQNTGQDQHSLSTNPMLKDAENYNFQITSSSPCLNKGADVSIAKDFSGIEVPKGGVPDIGAFEYMLNACPMLAVDLDGNSLSDVAIDFGPDHGIWGYMNNGSWERIHNLSCVSMQKADLDADPKDELIVDFGTEHGIWILYNNRDWVKLHELSCDQIVAVDKNKDNIADEIIIDFGQYGIWIYNPQDQDQPWTQLHDLNPESIDIADDEVIVVDFGQEYGIWALTPDPENPWMFIHELSPEYIEIADIDNDGGDEGIMNFGIYGVWIFDEGIWTQLHHISPASITPLDIDGQQGKDLVMDFGIDDGIWIYYNNSSWTKLHNLSPDWIVGANLDNDESKKDDLVIDFGPEYGIWKNENQSPDWYKIHELSV